MQIDPAVACFGRVKDLFSGAELFAPYAKIDIAVWPQPGVAIQLRSDPTLCEDRANSRLPKQSKHLGDLLFMHCRLE
jgi:hypothetical protein